MAAKRRKRKKADPPDRDKRVKKIERRLAALEAHLAATDAAGSDSAADSTAAAHADERFWALHGLRGRVRSPGAVVFAGAIDLPPGEHIEWQWGEDTAGLLDTSWAPVSERVAALAHPVRLELLRHVLRGVRTTAELTGLDVMGTTGQLYHHLNQLIAAGWLCQSGRGRYQVPAERVVPALVVVAALRA